jgi:exonuclease SbcC
MLKSIRLENWKSHKDSFIYFKPGTNFFIGKMGSGKSSTVDAISFALFGTFPKLNRKECSLKDLKNFNMQNQPTKVELEFSDPEDETKIYKVIRQIDETSKATLMLNNQVICTKPNLVNQEIEKIIKINYDVFSKAIYCEQNNLNYWLELQPSKRKAQLDELLELEKFELVRINLVSYSNKLIQQLKEIENRLNSTTNKKLKEEYENYKQKIIEQKNKIEEIQKKLQEAKEEYEQINQKYLEQKKKQERLNSLEKEIAFLKSKIQTIEQQIKKINYIDEQKIENEKKEKSKQLEELTTKLKINDKEIKELVAKIEKIKNQILENEKSTKELIAFEENLKKLLYPLESFEDFKKHLQNQEEDYRQKHSEIAQLQKENESFKIIIQALLINEKQAHCPVCEQSLDNKKRNELKEKYNKIIQENLEKIKDLQNKTSQIQKEIEELKKKTYTINSIYGKIEQIKKTIKKEYNLKELEELEKKKNELEKEKEQMNQKMDQIKSDIYKLNNQLSENKKIIELKDELNKSNLALQKYNEELDNLGFSAIELEKTIEQLKDISSKKSSTQKDLFNQQEILENITNSAKIFEEQIKEIENLEKKEQQINLELTKLKAFENALILTQIQLREYIIEQINKALKVIWPIIYPYEDWTELKITSEPEGYKVYLFHNEWKSIEAFPSGGEKACAALCLRIALSFLLVPNLKWLILDEPTHNLDLNTVNKLADALNKNLPNLVSQTIVITHEERLVKEDANNIIRFDREKTKDSITNILT